MKIQLQYTVLVHDDEGNLVADVEAKANITSVQALVSTIQGAFASLCETPSVDAEIASILAKAAANSKPN